MSAAPKTSDLGSLLTEIQDSLKQQNAVLQKLVAALTAVAPDKEDRKTSPSLADNDKNRSNNHEGGNDDLSNQVSALPDEEAEEESEFLRRRVAFYPKESESKYFLSLEPLNSSDGPPQRGTADGNWKYWTPVYQDKQNSDHAAGRPDYIPPWELREHNGQLYHIDDREMSCPIPFSERLINSSQIKVPYAFMPPSRLILTPIASTGITVNWDLLQQCLGDLYSVPPDDRLPLSFERNELRVKCASGKIYNYLRRIKAFFEELHGKNGYFFVRDFDRNLQPFAYNRNFG
ncbi:hypothetical protein VTN96DRAFT_5430 [Rasamsonia emersonii]